MKLIRHFLWLAPILAILGCFSYFLYFYFFEVGKITAILRDSAALNIALVALALVMAIVCLCSCWKRYSIPAKCLSILNVLIALSCFGMLVSYVSYISAQMPDAEETQSLEKVEAFRLVSSTGKTIESDKGDYEGKNLLLSFYRGYW